MHDQADTLRQLVLQPAAAAAPAAGRPRLVVLGSGKGGVGTTTLAVNLAVAAAQASVRTVLVDADPDGSDVAMLTGVRERFSLADVLAGRRRAAEALQPGPAGVQVLPGAWGLERLSDYPPAAADRLIEQFNGFQATFDLVVIDAGNSPGRLARRLWRAADAILAVTSPETASLLDTYSAVKALCCGAGAPPLFSLVNFAPPPPVSRAVHDRLAAACRRFLGVAVQPAGEVPQDASVAAASRGGKPVMLGAPESPAARHVRRLAAWLIGRSASKAEQANMVFARERRSAST